ncbi:MAG: hypothetical protein BroJett040_03320 [Oligoflexia bacterium]|nr:MAG: hypothetical protein BroJett040_03320 [Oligoflexia bacterium]
MTTFKRHQALKFTCITFLFTTALSLCADAQNKKKTAAPAPTAAPAKSTNAASPTKPTEATGAQPAAADNTNLKGEVQPPAPLAPPPPPKRNVSSAYNADYNVPLRFEVSDENVNVKPLLLDYEMIAQTNLKLASSEFNDNTFYVVLSTLDRLEPALGPLLAKSAANEWVLVVRWPDDLFQDGIIEAMNRAGKTLWQAEITPDSVKKWKRTMAIWKATLKKKSGSEAAEASPVLKTQFAIRNFKAQGGAPFWKIEEPIRFCVSKTIENGLQTRLCTRYYEVAKSNDRIAMSPLKQAPTPARVIAFGGQAPLKDVKEVEANKPVQFFAEIASGASYEFVAKPVQLNLVEIVGDDNNPDVARLVAWGRRPVTQVRVLTKTELTFLEELIGPWWYQTIGDFREFYDLELTKAKPMLVIPGEGGGLFRQDFVLKNIPTEKIRPYVSKRTPKGVYQDGAKILGRKAAGTKVSSTTNGTVPDSSDPANSFVWNFGAQKRGDFNKSYLLVESEGVTYKAYSEHFKGYPGEISTRLTGIVGSDTVIMGEVMLNYWFEDLFGWTNYWLSRQRWGVSAKYFQSLTKVKVGQTQSTLNYLTLDFKYRLNPGLWGRDESWGLMGSYNEATYDIFKAKLFGGGMFWARSMPKIFDDLFNYVPLMRYPKWVDMEFIYYVNVINSSEIKAYNFGQGLGNWQLNFHGKVMWTKQFFGEAGFGIKQLDFQQNVSMAGVTRQRMQFTLFYGTMGLGWSF